VLARVETIERSAAELVGQTVGGADLGVAPGGVLRGAGGIRVHNAMETVITMSCNMPWTRFQRDREQFSPLGGIVMTMPFRHRQ
jgi:hypothetical protein